MVSHHPTKFRGLRHCGSGDIMFQWLKSKIPHALLNNVDHSLRNYDLHNSLMSNKQLYHNLFYFYRKQYFNTSFPTYFEASLVTVETSASTVILPTISQTSKLYLQKLLPRQQYCFHVQKNFTDRLVDKYTVSRICYILYNYVFLSRVINLDYFSLNLH